LTNGVLELKGMGQIPQSPDASQSNRKVGPVNTGVQDGASKNKESYTEQLLVSVM
jgi:hypothetical protein